MNPIDMEDSDMNPIDVEDNLTEDSVSSSRNPRKKTSKVWKTFERLPVGVDKTQRAQCTRCKAILLCGPGNGTTSMKRHVESRCPNRELNEVETHRSREIDQNIYRGLVAETVVQHNLPFRYAEYKGVRKTHAYLNPDVKFVSRNTLKADVLKLYKKEKDKLKISLQSVPSRICLTSDLWSSITSDGYMALTAHYVDSDWKLQKKVLIFRNVPPPHNGPVLAEWLIDYLKEWGIDKKIFTVTLDNAGYNNGLIDVLKDHFSMNMSEVCNSDFLHIRCGAHILNLIVQDGLKTIDVAIEKIRDSVKYVKWSKSRGLKLAECAKQLSIDVKRKLKQDMPVRWNSTYEMLDSALLYSRAFTRLERVDPNYKWCPSVEEWDRVQRIAKFLKPFFDMTKLFSGVSYPTSNLYFHNVWRIQKLIQEEIDYGDIVTSSMAYEMKPKFDKYWKCYSVVLSFAVVLDPRYKLQFVEFCYDKLDPLTCDAKVKEVGQKMQSLLETYLTESSSSSAQSSNVRARRYDDVAEQMAEFDAFKTRHRAARKKSQLDLYLEEELVSWEIFPELNVLDYWKENCSRYPELSLMARDVLSIPITSVASESAFSIGGRIISKYRSRILPENAEATLCSRDWLDDYSSGDEEEEEKQLSMDIESLVGQLESANIDIDF